jgi:uncharacterized protein GlcG (DUF336 family)
MAELRLEDARRVEAAAEAKATELAVGVTITIVDGGGHVRMQSRMDGARFGTVMISTNKAFTAAAAGFPSKILADLTQPGQSLFGLSDAAGGRIVVFGGGVPIVREEAIVGAIGVSGGSVDQDQDIADAGAAAL